MLGKLIRSEGPQEILVAVLMRVMWYGFLVFLMNASVMTAIIGGFQQLGKNASGISVFNPADVFWQGIDLVNIMMSSFADNANIAGVPVPAGLAAAANPMVAFLLGLTIILIVLSFLILTAQYSVILVQMYFYLACYPLIVAMGGIKQGRDMTTKAISAAIVIGVRFLAIYFVMFAAQQMATTMGQQLANLSLADLSPMWAVFGMSGLLAFLALKVPQMASDLLGGTASLSGGDAVATAAVAAGAAGAIAGGVASLAGGAANGVAGAIKAGQSAISQAREKGASGIVGTAAGATGAISGAVGEAAGQTIKGLGSSSAGGRLADRIDATTAGIREAKAAGTPAPSTPSGQPAAPAPATPAAPANVSPPAPQSGKAEDSAPEPTRETPPPPTTESAAPAIAPAAPAATGTAAATPAQPSAPVAATVGATTPPAAPVAAPEVAASSPSASTAEAGPTSTAPTSTAPAAPEAAASAPAAPATEAVPTSTAPTSTAPAAPEAAASAPAAPATEGGSIGGVSSSPAAAPTESTQQQQPQAPASNRLAENLVNELKQADKAHGASVNIQTGGHE